MEIVWRKGAEFVVMLQQAVYVTTSGLRTAEINRRYWNNEGRDNISYWHKRIFRFKCVTRQRKVSPSPPWADNNTGFYCSVVLNLIVVVL